MYNHAHDNFVNQLQQDDHWGAAVGRPETVPVPCGEHMRIECAHVFQKCQLGSPCILVQRTPEESELWTENTAVICDAEMPVAIHSARLIFAMAVYIKHQRRTIGQQCWPALGRKPASKQKQLRVKIDICQGNVRFKTHRWPAAPHWAGSAAWRGSAAGAAAATRKRAESAPLMRTARRLWQTMPAIHTAALSRQQTKGVTGRAAAPLSRDSVFEGSRKAVEAQGDAPFANHACLDRFCQRSGALVRVETCCQTGIVKRQTVHGQLLAARPVVTCYMAEHPIMQLSFRGPYRRLMVTAGMWVLGC